MTTGVQVKERMLLTWQIFQQQTMRSLLMSNTVGLQQYLNPQLSLGTSCQSAVSSRQFVGVVGLLSM